MSDEELITTTDIAEQCGVTVQAVTNWRRRYTDFPVHTLVFRRTKLYNVNDVENFLQANGLPK